MIIIIIPKIIIIIIMMRVVDFIGKKKVKRSPFEMNLKMFHLSFANK